MKRILTAAAVVALASVAPASADVVGGTNFTSSATSLIASSGAFNTSGGTVASVVTDNNPGTWAGAPSGAASLTLGFSGGILNGAGVDFALFDLGVNATFGVTINGVTVNGLTSGTGFSAGGFNLNVAFFDLSSFGLASGASISSMFINMSLINGGNPAPALSYAGVLNTGIASGVPEPSTWAMMLIGFAGLGYMSARKRKVASAA